ncbi:uncharacterized protein AB675_4881 [Cyphellophora attinorum]|uniref:Uncharacterized protein n=1 Tax=Cyphellophora attinorum TaxID=1664694 RepID=A0A0N0NHP9_9EURO|nr:uncharacterized protein AB675_4881 [Phialophora attinorum]KPI34818.1 hypothetical protein AB675_4881 [Phialophora attinorum]
MVQPPQQLADGAATRDSAEQGRVSRMAQKQADGATRHASTEPKPPSGSVQELLQQPRHAAPVPAETAQPSKDAPKLPTPTRGNAETAQLRKRKPSSSCKIPSPTSKKARTESARLEHLKKCTD